MKAGKDDPLERIKKAVAAFNKYRSPEANAKLVSFKGRSLRVEFTGHFCRTCGFYDYFDDFLIFLEEAGLKMKTGEVKEIPDGAVVRFTGKA